MIVPTPAFRRQVHPRRGHALAPCGKDKWSDYAERWSQTRNAWLAGAEHAAPQGEPLWHAVTLLDSAEWPAEFSLEHFAAAERVLNGHGSIVTVVAARYGAVAALRMKLRSLSFAIDTARAAKKRTYWRLGPSNPTNPWMFETGWDALRWVMCAADDASHRAARDEAARVREDAGLLSRTLIAYAFPDEPAWANAALLEANAAVDFAKHVNARAALLASTDDEPLAAAFLSRCESWGMDSAMRFACDLVLGLGVEASSRVLLAELARAIGTRGRAAALCSMATALTSSRTTDVATALAPLLRHDVVGRYVVSYFEHAPDLAQRALPEIAGAKSLLGDAARHVLARTGGPRAGDLAPESEWPPLLRDAPWRARWKAPPVVLELGELPYDEKIEWADGERARVLDASLGLASNATVEEMTPELLAEFKALPRTSACADFWIKWLSTRYSYYVVPDDLALELWSDPRTRLARRTPLYMLAKLGNAALPGLFARDAFGEGSEIFDTLLRVDSPRAAAACARAMARRKPWRSRAIAWLLGHAEAAALGLVPIAMSQAKDRGEAGRALVLLAAHGHREVLLDVAERFGSPAHDATRRLLDEDPLSHIEEVRSPPAAVKPEGLPPLRARASGRELPSEAVARVLEVLRGVRPELPYPGLALLRDALDPRSAAAFAWALFEAWDLHGRRRADEWMAYAVTTFHDDEITGRLIARAREYAQRFSSACVVLFEILSTIGGDSGDGGDSVRMHIAAIAERSGLETLSSAATRLLGDEAARDHVVGTLGLDERGTARFDLGSRAVTFSLDETLRPIVRLEDGRRLAQLPRPSKDDDPALAAHALAAWRSFCRDSAVIAETQPRRFERAMVAGRRFSAQELDAIARHPVLGHLVRRLVWGVYAPELRTTFRVVEDGTLTDSDDRPWNLPPDARVGIVHPFSLAEDERALWAALFADYEILQPFEQLAREVIRADAGVAQGAEIRMSKEPVAPAALLALFDARGWKRTRGGYLRYAWRDVLLASGGSARAQISFTPGITLTNISQAKPQKLDNLKLLGAKAFSDVTEIEMSELLRDIAPWRAYP